MKAKTQYKVTIDEITLYSRWKYRKYARPCDFLIIGIMKYWIGWDIYYYRFCLFGVELRVWFKREII
jgi:hypothetical protein